MNKNLFIKLLAFIVLSIASFGIISNIIHFMEIRRTETINFKEISPYKEFKDTLKSTKGAIEKINIDNYTGQLDKTILTKVNTNINSCLDSLEKSPILSLKDKENISVKDIYYLITKDDNGCTLPINQSIKMIAENDTHLKQIDKLLTPQLLLGMVSREPIMQKVYSNYNYYAIDSQNYLMEYKQDLYNIASYHYALIAQLEFITNWLYDQIGDDNNE